MFPSKFVVGIATVLVLLLHVAAEVDGVGLLLFVVLGCFSIVAAISWSRPLNTSQPWSQRPLDLVCVIGFVSFAVIAVLVDAVQAGAGPGTITTSYGPSLMAEAFRAWVAECDVLLGKNPLWYWFLAGKNNNNSNNNTQLTNHQSFPLCSICRFTSLEHLLSSRKIIRTRSGIYLSCGLLFFHARQF